MPDLTIVMPMRNAGPFVVPALKSLLPQEGPLLEIVVVDDGSTDGSPESVRALNDPRIRLIPGPRCGIAAAFNAGLAAASAPLLARCDADDLYTAGRLAWQAEWLADHPDFVAVCGAFEAVDHKGRHLSGLGRKPDAAEITDELRAGVVRTHFCTYAVRTDALRRIGGCRTFFKTAEDVDLQLRLAWGGRVAYEPRLCYTYRLHAASATHTQADVARRFYESTARRFNDQRRDGLPDDLERGCPPPSPNEDGPSPLLDEQIVGYLTSRAWKACRDRRRAEALTLGLRAWWTRPARYVLWLNLIKLAARCVWPGPTPSPESPSGNSSLEARR